MVVVQPTLAITRTALLLTAFAAGCTEPPAAPAEPNLDHPQLLKQARDLATRNESRRLAALVREGPAEHTRNILLAVEAVRTALDHELAVPPEALGQLINLARFTRPSRILPVSPSHVELGPDGHRLLTVEDQTSLKLRSVDDDSPPIHTQPQATDVAPHPRPA